MVLLLITLLLTDYCSTPVLNSEVKHDFTHCELRDSLRLILTHQSARFLQPRPYSLNQDIPSVPSLLPELRDSLSLPSLLPKLRETFSSDFIACARRPAQVRPNTSTQIWLSLKFSEVCVCVGFPGQKFTACARRSTSMPSVFGPNGQCLNWFVLRNKVSEKDRKRADQD